MGRIRRTSAQSNAVTLSPHVARAPLPSRQYLTGKNSSAADRTTTAMAMTERSGLNSNSPATPANRAIANTV